MGSLLQSMLWAFFLLSLLFLSFKSELCDFYFLLSNSDLLDEIQPSAKFTDICGMGLSRRFSISKTYQNFGDCVAR